MKTSRRPSFLAAAPAIIVIFIASVLPLLWMLAVIVANPTARSELHLSRFRTELLGRTLGYNGLAAVIATIMGVPAGYVLGRGRGLLARLLWVILPAALLMPSLSYAYGWKLFTDALEPYLRLQGQRPIFGWHLPIHIHFSPTHTFRCIWILATWLWSVPATLVGLALRRLDTNVQQQALLDGALRRVTFRQLLGPIIAALCIVTVIATQEFSVYEPTGISVVATEMRMVFDTGSVSSITNSMTASLQGIHGLQSPDQAARAAAAVTTCAPLLLVTAILAIVAVRAVRWLSDADTLGIGDWPRSLDASRITVLITVLLVLMNVGLPVVSLFASLHVKFSPTKIWGEFAPQLIGSLIVAGETAFIATAVALFAAAGWLRGMLLWSTASFLIGGQLLAIALIRLYNHPGLSWALDTSAVIGVIAYLGRFGWLAVAAARSTWSRPWQELRDTASLDGAGPLACAFHVIWPLAWPVLLAGGLIVGALSLTEVPATVLLVPMNPEVLTPSLMTWLHMIRYDAMIEAALLMMAGVLVPAVAAILLTSFGIKITLNLRRGANSM